MHSATFAFEAIGTKWVIDCYEIASKISEEDLLKRIQSRIEEFDKTYSRFREDSLVWEISKKAGKYKFPSDAEKFFQLYNSFNKLTQGKFTLLIGNTLSEAGYDFNYSLKPKEIKKVPETDQILKYDHPFLEIDKPYILDFGGLGKGYLIDLIADILKSSGVVSYCIDGGGDIIYETRNAKPLSVGLENPKNHQEVIGVVKIKNESICASSGNRRAWDKYHHIIDPDSLSSPKNILATWVISKDAVIADGIATCLFLVSPEKLLKYLDFEYLILFPDFTFNKSKKFNADLFIQNKK